MEAFELLAGKITFCKCHTSLPIAMIVGDKLYQETNFLTLDKANLNDG
jgi:hypothetical protein